VRLLISLAVCALTVLAGPLEFGLNELNTAFAERKLKWKPRTEISLDAPESFRIEPYRYGGAYISGGDLRGLMYGLLEAAEQVRSTGRIVKARGVAATPLRGVRLRITPELEHWSEEDWRAYFQGLARNRFNRAHVDVPRLERPYELPCLLSRIAADYAVDFTLGLGSTGEELPQVLSACPQVQSIALGPAAGAQSAAIEAARQAGRRVALDFHGEAGTHADPDLPVLRPRLSWPPSFEVVSPGRPEDHSLFFWIWGRLGYDPKTKPPGGTEASEIGAAREIALWIAAIEQARSTGSDFIAADDGTSQAEASGSAKLRPRELAGRLNRAAAKVDGAAAADLRLFAELAHAEARELDPAGQSGDSPEALRPQITHVAPTSVAANQPLVLHLQIGSSKQNKIETVRLHYRLLDPSADERVLTLPAASDVSFTIPGSELNGTWDVQYYFEILHREGSGWFEPDPLTGVPPPVVKVIASRTGPN